MPWAIHLPGHAGTLHPTQIYEAAGNLVIFAGLSAYYRRKRFDSQICWLYVLIYGALRFGVEFFRGDYDVHYFGVLTIAQLMAGGLMIVAVTGLVLYGKIGARSVNSQHHATY